MTVRKALPLGLILALAVSACAPVPRESGVNDPYESANREVHAFNKELDTNILKPISGALGPTADGQIGKSVGNFASNLALPRMVVNNLLQLDIVHAFSNTARFALNSTFGIAGLFDVAGQNLITEYRTDFGETLHVWGVPEGAYIELPFFGASTERDAIGTAVDFLIDPLNYVLPSPEKYIGTAAYLVDRVGDRARYAGLVDQILYESADSYAQTRLLYLQSRRRDLYGELAEEFLEDPYAE